MSQTSLTERATEGTQITNTTNLPRILSAGPTTATLHAHYADVAVATTTSLTSTPDPVIVGGSVTYTATVNPAPDGGTVAFTDGTTTIPGCTEVPITAAGTASCTTTYATVGSHRVTATYTGDTAYKTSASTAATENVAYGQHILTSGGYTTGLGSAVTVILRITNSSGKNLSNSHTVLHATALDGKPIHGVIGGTRTTNFPYHRWLHAYTFLAAEHPALTPGTHTLTYTAGGDPTTHTVTITVHRL